MTARLCRNAERFELDTRALQASHLFSSAASATTLVPYDSLLIETSNDSVFVQSSSNIFSIPAEIKVNQ